MSNPTVFRNVGVLRENSLYLRRVLRPGDDILIEGFPRSANTFATHAFIISQNRTVKVGNHFHSPAQFALAQRFRIPAMLVVREPLGAIRSMATYDPAQSIPNIALRYIHFHKKVLPFKAHYFVAEFDAITSDFGALIRRLNERFGTSFSTPIHDEAFTQSVFKKISSEKHERDSKLGRSGTGTNRITIPDSNKSELQRQTADIEKLIPRLLDSARSIHAQIISDHC